MNLFLELIPIKNVKQHQRRCQWQSPINQFLLIYCAGKVYSDSSKALTRFCNRESTRVEINFRQKAFKMHLRYVHRKLGSLSMFLINIDWSDKAAPFNFSCRRALSEQLLKGKFRDEMKMYWKMHSSWKKVMNWVKTKKRNRSQRALDKENREEKKLREKSCLIRKICFPSLLFAHKTWRFERNMTKKNWKLSFCRRERREATSDECCSSEKSLSFSSEMKEKHKLWKHKMD